MSNQTKLPKKIPVFPLSNFIFFPNTSAPLNIFEPRYLDMVNDSMKSNKLIGMIQPKNSKNKNGIPELHNVGCLGKIISFRETEDGRFLIELKGKIRFQIINEINRDKKYRSVEVDYNEFSNDLDDENEKLNFSDLEIIFKDLKTFLIFTPSKETKPPVFVHCGSPAPAHILSLLSLNIVKTGF